MFAGLLLSASQAYALAPADVFARHASSVVVLETYDGAGKPTSVLSATTIAANTVVTVCNAIDSAAELRVAHPRGSLAAKLQARDQERNLCLLLVTGLDSPALTTAGGSVAGNRVYAVSNALGLGIGMSDGIISGVRKFQNSELLQFTAPISPGSEGGALIDDQGRLLGIIDYRRRDGQNVNFAMPATWVGEIAPRAAAAAPRLRRYERALELNRGKNWDELLRLSETWTKEEPDNADGWAFFITAAHEKKMADAELRGWRELYRKDPGQKTTSLGLGWQLALRGQYDEANQIASRFVTENPSDSAAWYLMGIIQQARGLAEDAEKSMLRAIELDPWLIEAYQNLARLAQARGNSALAIATWRRLAGLRSNDPGTQWGLVNAYLMAGKPDKAWLVLERLGEHMAADATYWYWRGRTLFAHGAHEQACAAYRKSLDIKKDNEWAWGGMGYARLEQRRFTEAVAAFREARRISPDNDEWPYQLAIALKDGGQPEEAFAITTGLVAKAPQQSRNWRQHGFVLGILGRPAEAVPALERSLQIEPRQAKTWSALIEEYYQLDKPAEVRRAYETLRGIDSAAAETMYRKIVLPAEAYRP